MKNVLVTGATGGMGKAICSLLNEKGYRVFGLDYNEGEDYGNVSFYKCDVTDMASVESVYENISKQTKNLAAVIHTAGIYDLDSLIEMDEKRFVKIFDVNVFGVFRINKVFKPLLFTGSRIIITSSELAPLDPLPFTGIYGITKTTLEKYAFSLRQELQLLDIPVSVIRPGAVKTGLLNVSNVALERFRNNTKLYVNNAKKFQTIVDSVESRHIPAEKIAELALEALESKKPKYLYNINRNPLLMLLNVLPAKAQVFAIGLILKS
ncbi:MAG: SDR family NAD(P)-dependent oxidoreductase [Ruminococcaceae bacterium]|nr:SDR family NAD(P)-dependent oxidoreductase [Oscillospiraceae bacterium]